MNLSRSRKGVLAGLPVLLLFTLAACMWMPAARDDFSVLGNDPFSNLIREARFEKGDPNTGRNVGVSRIDAQKATQLARELLLGKTSSNVIELFDQEGGHCLPLVSATKEKRLTCEVSRQWKLKNIGAPFDTRNWSKPAAKLIFKMALSDTDTLVDLELDVVDITIRKPIYSR